VGRSFFEKVSNASVTDDYHHLIRAGTNLIVLVRSTGSNNETYYVTRDHLSSSSVVTNSAGAVILNESFAAYGRRRGSNWTGVPSTTDWNNIASTTRHGFTDHTMLDNLDLVHMNGRVFDDVIGRFVSADPTLGGGWNSQVTNPYSYVGNNPLNATDPTGFDDCVNDGRKCDQTGPVTSPDPINDPWGCNPGPCTVPVTGQWTPTPSPAPPVFVPFRPDWSGLGLGGGGPSSGGAPAQSPTPTNPCTGAGNAQVRNSMRRRVKRFTRLSTVLRLRLIRTHLSVLRFGLCSIFPIFIVAAHWMRKPLDHQRRTQTTCTGIICRPLGFHFQVH
jgi:RHS repeat-associated protein